MRRSKFKHVVAPGWKVEVETTRQQVVAAPLVNLMTHEVRQPNGVACQFAEGELT